MRIVEFTRYGEENEMLVVEFENKYGYKTKIQMNTETKVILVECDSALADEVLEAIEMVKSGKLEIEL